MYEAPAARVGDSLYRPSFADDWPRVELYPLATWINGMAFRDIHFSSAGRPVIKISEVKSGVTQQTKRTDQEYAPHFRVQAGDLLFSWSGQPETSIGAFVWRGPEGWLNQHIFRVEVNTATCDARFFRYLLDFLRPNFVEIARNKQTTGLGHVTKSDLENITVGLPPMPNQRAIADVVSALDAKLDANARLGDACWALAQAYFDRAVAEAAEMMPLGSVMDLSYGKALPAVQRVPGDVPVYGSGGVVGSHVSSLVDGPGIILGRKGTVGSAYWSQAPFFPIDTTYYVVPRGDVPLAFAYFALKTLRLSEMNFDSAVPGLSRASVLMRQVPLPTMSTLASFRDRSMPLIERAQFAEAESGHLTTLRDVLLPALMSGRIRVERALRASM